jgi:hypothetical protein
MSQVLCLLGVYCDAKAVSNFCTTSTSTQKHYNLSNPRPLFPEFLLQGTFSRHLSLLVSLTYQDSLILTFRTDVNNNSTPSDLVICILARVDYTEPQTLNAFHNYFS